MYSPFAAQWGAPLDERWKLNKIAEAVIYALLTR